jgi:aminodeoxyfutalosine synthase
VATDSLPFRYLAVDGPIGVGKTSLVDRLVLDNVPHIKAYWVMVTPKLAQVALSFGADDLDGTVVSETIYHMAGAETAQMMPRAELERVVREAGYEPVERDTLYHPVHRAA